METDIQLPLEDVKADVSVNSYNRKLARVLKGMYQNIAQAINRLSSSQGIARKVTSDPQDATPGNRPSGSLGELVQYDTDKKLYFCTDSSAPTWEKITSS